MQGKGNWQRGDGRRKNELGGGGKKKSLWAKTIVDSTPNYGKRYISWGGYYGGEAG